MPRLSRKRSIKTGLPPGTPIYVGARAPKKTKIKVIDYDDEHFIEKELAAPEECLEYKKRPTTTWIKVVGLSQINTLEALGKCLGLHPLVIEDIFSTNQRPKIEDYGDYLYIIMKSVGFDDEKGEMESEQISIIIGGEFVLSIQEHNETIFQPVIDRIRMNQGPTRRMQSDFLAYSLLDAIVDNYFVVIEKVSDKIEILEDALMSDPTQEILHDIHRLKQNMIILRKSVWPFREVISRIERTRFSLINEKLIIYFRDIYDHTIQVMETIETYRDMLSGMLDIYLSSVSNRMNEVMKVLTIIATIFIPLTLIAGIYGMNFSNMPELTHPWGYPLVWISMICVGVIMLAYFRRRKWL